MASLVCGESMQWVRCGVSAWSEGRALPGCGEWWPFSAWGVWWVNRQTWTIASAAVWPNVRWRPDGLGRVWKYLKLFLNDGNIFFYENIRKSFPVNHSSSQEKICLICSVKHVKLFQSESYLWTVVIESQSFQVPLCGNEWCCSHESGTLLVTDPSTVI